MAPQHLLVKVSPIIAKPFVKWVGGKRRVIPELLLSLPTTFDHYYEPQPALAGIFFQSSRTSMAMGPVITCHRERAP